MDSAEFSEWLWADARGELPDAYDTFGMVTAAVMNAGFRHPEKPVGKEDFRPKFISAEDRDKQQVAAFERMTKPPDYREFIWKT